MSSSFHTSYVTSGMHGNAFLPLGAGDTETRIERARHTAKKKLAPAIVQALRAQNPSFDERGDTAFVVTGQQVGLFLGPLYTLAKAASAIAWARILSNESGVRCRPLFWLQTEDHDFEEVRSCSVPRHGHEPPVTLTLDDAAPKKRIPLAERCLSADVATQLGALKQALEGTKHGDEVMALLERHYRAGEPMARAFGGVLSEMFAAHGLLVFDPRTLETARVAAPVIARALTEQVRIDELLGERSAALQRAGYKEQIHLRAGTPLPFFHDEHGERHRVSGGHDLAARVAQEPLRFSTSALLRPIVQDTLLPVALYVGGPAEVDYFAQCSCLYPVFDLPPPLVAQRARIRLITPRIASTLDKLGLHPSDLELSHEALVERVLARAMSTVVQGPQPSWLRELDQHLQAFTLALPPGDLERAVQRTQRSVHHALSRLERRYQRAVLERERTLADRLHAVEHWLRPNGEPQERVHSFAAFAARCGVSALVELLVSAVDPLQPKLVDVRL